MRNITDPNPKGGEMNDHDNYRSLDDELNEYYNLAAAHGILMLCMFGVGAWLIIGIIYLLWRIWA